MYNYLKTDGKNLIPEIVENNMGSHWYTGLLKNLADTKLGNGIFMNKFLDKTLPTVNGDNTLARTFFDAGGKI